MPVAPNARVWWHRNPASVVAFVSAMIAGICTLALAGIYFGLRAGALSVQMADFCSPNAHWVGIPSLAPGLGVAVLVLGLCAALSGALGTMPHAGRRIAMVSAFAGMLLIIASTLLLNYVALRMVILMIC